MTNIKILKSFFESRRASTKSRISIKKRQVEKNRLKQIIKNCFLFIILDNKNSSIYKILRSR